MKHVARQFWAGFAMASLIGGGVRAQGGNSAGKESGVTTGIEDVTVISPERKAPLEHATGGIRDGKIAEIGTRLAVGAYVEGGDGGGEIFIAGGVYSGRAGGGL